MKFKQYINEDKKPISTIEEFNEILHDKCKPYLQLIKPFNEPLKRGMATIGMIMGIKSVRKDRNPRGTKHHLFEIINKWLQKNGHNRRDNSFMVTSGDTNQFGSPFYVFPIGKFSYTWLRASDMNFTDDKTGWIRINIMGSIFNFKTNKWIPDTTIGRMMIDKNITFDSFFTTDKDIKTAIKNKYEIWIKCDEYLFINSRSFVWDKKTQKMENP